MNNLLIFFALPIAVVIISIALQKILKCPFLVAGIVFAIFLVATFIIGNLEFLVATIAYTILSFITALVTNVITRIIRNLDNDDNESSSSCNCSNSNTIAVRANVIPNSNTNGRSGNFCGCFRRR